MKSRISRRLQLGLSPLALASCARGGEYFGNTEPPRAQRLVYQIGAEPETLDPAKSQAGSENYIIGSLFEGLVTLHPSTHEPLAHVSCSTCGATRSRAAFGFRTQAKAWRAVVSHRQINYRLVGAMEHSSPRTTSFTPGAEYSTQTPPRRMRRFFTASDTLRR